MKAAPSSSGPSESSPPNRPVTVTLPPKTIDWSKQTDGTAMIAGDAWLEPYAAKLRTRHAHYRKVLQQFDSHGGLTGQVSRGHEYFGFTRGELWEKKGVWYREWAPAALQLRLIGDFNNWDRFATPLVRDSFGVWSIFLPDDEYADKLVHGSRVKVHVIAENTVMDRIPAYVRRVVQEKGTNGFVGIYWNPPTQFQWKHEGRLRLREKCGLRVYEAHTGMAQEQEKVGTFDEFTKNVLPRIKKLGYNAIQLMAVMEHPYYGSFGYHVSNFFAVSSRFGTPEELKNLVDTAHGMGLLVIMDLVHSHAVKNTHEGLNLFDGTDYQYFHGGPRGQHIAWDSLCFDYKKYEVLRFLLSNVRFWLEEFRFDGFRFDGVTSMMYLDHGLGREFSGYDDYFGANIDDDAVAYLQLANELAHKVNPNAITVAEDVSGMAGMARPVDEGGIGFDYRLAMGVPDYWIKHVKEKKDEDWKLGDIYHTLLNRRRAEKHVGYSESHDQSLVGDKTLAMWLIDKEIYTNMAWDRPSLVVDRGIALHKMIRLITFSLAGEGYLNFMGNEFGHPEWVDFPREGNGYSYKYARRQWNLADNDLLRYKGLNAFDAAMQQLDETYGVLCDPLIEQLALHENNKELIYRRGPLVFAFNFHPTRSAADFRIPVPDRTDYKLVLDTDEPKFAGHSRIDPNVKYVWQPTPLYGRQQSIQIYLPAQSAPDISAGLMRILDLGLISYNDAWEQQRRMHEEVKAGGEEAIFLLEHSPVITMGRRGETMGVTNLRTGSPALRALGVEFVQSDRGGDVTFHGPGQLVCYPILRLVERKISVGRYVKLLQSVVIATLARFDIVAETDEAGIGVWVNPPNDAATTPEKICAFGIRVSRGVSMHGLALNVTTDLSYFDLIVPCGIVDRRVTSMQKFLPDQCPPMPVVKSALSEELSTALAAAV